MSRTQAAPLPSIPLMRRVPGAVSSLVLSAFCLAISALVAWRHPLVELAFGPRDPQPLGHEALQRPVMDGTVKRLAWGLFPVGQTDLRNVTQFTMHTKSGGAVMPEAVIRAVTHDGVREIFTGDDGGTVRCMALLNAQLDLAEPGFIKLKRACWPWFFASWVLLVLGLLVLVRNSILAPLHRRRLAHARRR